MLHPTSLEPNRFRPNVKSKGDPQFFIMTQWHCMQQSPATPDTRCHGEQGRSRYSLMTSFY